MRFKFRFITLFTVGAYKLQVLIKTNKDLIFVSVLNCYAPLKETINQRNHKLRTNKQLTEK